jgi:hypothetical protein
MSKQQEILNLYNQQREDLKTTEDEAKKYLLSIAQDDNVKQFINRFFEMKNDILDFNEHFESLLNFELFNIKIGDKLNNDNLMYEVVENTTDEDEITHAIFEMPLTFKFNDYILIVLNLFVKTNKDLVISEIMFEEYNSFSA